MKSSRKCWMCGLVADSAEHRYKKSDLIRIFGRNYSSKQVTYVRDDVQFSPQGANAKEFKYQNNLCKKCNNQRTQPYDLAYSEFIQWIFKNEDLVIKKRFIDFKDIYGDNYPTKQTNLFKYFIKILGCDIDADERFEVPYDLIKLFEQTHFITAAKISFSLTEDIINSQELHKFSKNILGKSPMTYFTSINSSINKRPQNIGFERWNYISWLNIHFSYLHDTDPKLGTPWVADKRVIYLGSKDSNPNFWEIFKYI